ncbi:MAG: RNA polymerase factor sigma-54, partial [Treponema sp.]|nr:RNA polymerase factor sigma-54 [Treponema sp.]
LEQMQRLSQTQAQRMSQKQIQAMRLLALSSQDMRAEIYRAVEDNPALEIVNDAFIDGRTTGKKTRTLHSDNTRLAVSSHSGAEKSERFQQLLEGEPDVRETLHDHLLFQLALLRLSPAEYALGKKLIDNCDDRGFHILAPESLLDAAQGEDERMLAHMLDCIHHMDPVGVCVTDVSESLLVQARIAGNFPPLALFLLDGHLDLLSPPLPEKIQKKLRAMHAEQNQLSFALPEERDRYSLSTEEIADALTAIKTLNPYPAHGFGQAAAHYVHGDVTVTKEAGRIDADDEARGIIRADDDHVYMVRLVNDAFPSVRIAPDFVSQQQGDRTVRRAVERAEGFLENIAFRQSMILRVCIELVRVQRVFFAAGPGHMQPLSQRTLAERIGVHESTVSRMAHSKYIQCAWGLFPVKYFFSSAVTGAPLAAGAAVATASDISRESVLVVMQDILAAHPAGAKPLSDQKLCDELKKRGISIARRTVAKYRASLAIDSSYRRQ